MVDYLSTTLSRMPENLQEGAKEMFLGDSAKNIGLIEQISEDNGFQITEATDTGVTYWIISRGEVKPFPYLEGIRQAVLETLERGALQDCSLAGWNLLQHNSIQGLDSSFLLTNAEQNKQPHTHFTRLGNHDISGFGMKDGSFVFIDVTAFENIDPASSRFNVLIFQASTLDATLDLINKIYGSDWSVASEEWAKTTEEQYLQRW